MIRHEIWSRSPEPLDADHGLYLLDRVQFRTGHGRVAQTLLVCLCVSLEQLDELEELSGEEYACRLNTRPGTFTQE